MSYTIKDLQKFAEKKGGKCLSEKYNNNASSYTWECENGHIFEKVWLVVKTREAWCRECTNGNGIVTLQKFAEKKGGKCLSTKYIRGDTKYEFSCSEGHQFSVCWNNLKFGKTKWCRQCNSMSIEDLQKHANDKGGKCLSEIYTNIDAKYLWECENGHQWEATWTNVKHSDTWCGKCLMWSFEEIEGEVQKRGGKCLELVSGSGISGRYTFECEDGHTWTTSASNVINGNTWCSQCNKLNLAICHEEAKKRNGKCLSTEYMNRRIPMLWECEKGHQFEAHMGAIRNAGTWCKKCHDDLLRLDIGIAHEIAEKRGGKCLSTEYINLETNMLWQCKLGHKWKAMLGNVKGKSSWCPKCRNKSEQRCREIFEDIFQQPYPNVRLPELQGLELDGYCKDTGIAFEYDGRQHFSYTPFFHRNGEEDFYRQQERDALKDKLCAENAITLIRIPFYFSYDLDDSLEEFIQNSLECIGC